MSPVDGGQEYGAYQDQEPAGRFHEAGGWFFGRAADGSVEVIPGECESEGLKRLEGQEPARGHVIPPDAWASIVASVSALGGTGDSFAAARDLHAGKP